MGHDRAGRRAEGVHPAHVAEHAPAEMMDMVVGDTVVVGRAGSKAPDPTHGDAQLVQVANLVVRDLIVSAVPDKHARPGGEHAAAVVDEVVVDGVVAGIGHAGSFQRHRRGDGAARLILGFFI